MTYPNLKAEIARSGLTYSEILERGKEDGRLDCTISTLSLKINGKAEFTLNESIALKDIIGTDLPLNELFKSEPEA
jgi:hypothetical protein|nr:MAG TPA: DNA binding protein [Caudoviricetes sp.]